MIEIIYTAIGLVIISGRSSIVEPVKMIDSHIWVVLMRA